jgi:acetyl-CoA acetyltransferase family protein
MNCASGMLAIAQGAELIMSGKAKAVIVGGTESMSHAPLQFPKAMSEFLEQWMRAKSLPQRLKVLASFRPAHLKPVITLLLGLTDPVSGLIMGKTAEVLAKRYGISRKEQDEFALLSHQNYYRAEKQGFYDDHRLTVFPPDAPTKPVTTDVGPRDNLTLDKLSTLKPYFDRQFGSVTIGNSCPVTDGAAACLLVSEALANNLGLKPTIFVRGFGFQGVAPEIMGLGPAVATPIALHQAGVAMRDIELVEINEAFAVQVLANLRIFASAKLYCDLTGESSSPLTAIPIERLNVNGGAIALGHPVGTSGTRIVINLYKEMQRRQYKLGLASICVGGGLGGAMVIENELAV